MSISSFLNADIPKINLVLVRVGAKHRISALLNVPKDRRNWDLAVSCYDEICFAEGAYIDYQHFYQGGKWDGIYNFFSEHADLITNYDYFWLVDDDIETNPQQVDDIFNYVKLHQFELAQPALTLDSYYSHRLTLECKGFLHRNTNLVEIMAPILSRNILKKILPKFENTRSGFGIDWYWQRLVDRPESSIAIIDAYPVGHRRPLRQHLRGMMKKEGLCPNQERQNLVEKLGLRTLYAVATQGLLKNGKIISSRYKMTWLMTNVYWQTRHLITARPWFIWDFMIFCWRQLFMPLGLPKNN